MTNEKLKLKGYLFLGMSVLSAVIASSLFFFKTDNQLYNLALSAPNSLPQNYVSFLKENERWSELIKFTEVYKSFNESYSHKVSYEIKKSLGVIKNDFVFAQEKRKSFEYWKTEIIKSFNDRDGNTSLQESSSQFLSWLIDYYGADYTTVYDSYNKAVDGEEFDYFDTALSALGIAMDLSALVSLGQSLTVTAPTKSMLLVIRLAAKKMTKPLRLNLLTLCKDVVKNPTKLKNLSGLRNLAFKSPELALDILTIPNDYNKLNNMLIFLSNSLSKDGMQESIEQGSSLLTFALFTKENINLHQHSNNMNYQNLTESNNIDGEKSINKIDEQQNKTEETANKSDQKNVLNRTIDSLKKTKDELLNLNKEISKSVELTKEETLRNQDVALKFKNKGLFSEELKKKSLNEIFSVMEIMEQQDRLISQELFLALCYGHQGLDALEQNKLNEFIEYRDCISSNSFKAKTKNIIILYRNIILIFFSVISFLSLLIFVSVSIRKRQQLPVDKRN